ncbi:hypothetical protein CEXT_552651 [Caerostris extrusa]|uniref:Uncharacterized protein n=1 Tax=Caerostris extrusa TaxID=172846 RepID=A0AAV4UX87_CAEEX|nr:hypothetical protein CEXT_552651 [Caerostris extrusa]
MGRKKNSTSLQRALGNLVDLVSNAHTSINKTHFSWKYFTLRSAWGEESNLEGLSRKKENEKRKKGKERKSSATALAAKIHFSFPGSLEKRTRDIGTDGKKERREKPALSKRALGNLVDLVSNAHTQSIKHISPGNISHSAAPGAKKHIIRIVLKNHKCGNIKKRSHDRFQLVDPSPKQKARVNATKVPDVSISFFKWYGTVLPEGIAIPLKPLPIRGSKQLWVKEKVLRRGVFKLFGQSMNGFVKHSDVYPGQSFLLKIQWQRFLT